MVHEEICLWYCFCTCTVLDVTGTRVILHLWRYVRKWKSVHDYCIGVGSGPSLAWTREVNQNGSSHHVKQTHLNENLSLRSRSASYVCRSMVRESCWGSQDAKEWASGNALHVKTLHELVVTVSALSSACQEPSSLQTKFVLLPDPFQTGSGVDEQYKACLPAMLFSDREHWLWRRRRKHRSSRLCYTANTRPSFTKKRRFQNDLCSAPGEVLFLCQLRIRSLCCVKVIAVLEIDI